jgi:hypothetical protein
MAGTNNAKPQNLRHSKTIHRPLITFVMLENQIKSAPASNFTLLKTILDPILVTAGRNGVAVPNNFSPDIDTEGVVTEAENNRVLVFESGSQNVPSDPATGREIYARIIPTAKGGLNYLMLFYTLDDQGNEVSYHMPSGTFDYFIPYRFSFEHLPDDAIIRVKSRRSNDDPQNGGQGGREVMQIITVTAENAPGDLLFSPIPNSDVWAQISGFEIDSVGSSPLQVAGKNLGWDTSTANFDLEQGDRMIVHYETYE